MIVCEHLRGRQADKNVHLCLGCKGLDDGHLITQVCGRACPWVLAPEMSLGAGSVSSAGSCSLVFHRGIAECMWISRARAAVSQDFIRNDMTLVSATGTVVTQLGEVRWMWRREILWSVKWSTAQGMVPRPNPKGFSPSSSPVSS